MKKENMKEFEDLVKQTEDFCVKSLHYSAYTIYLYQNLWKQIKHLMIESNLEVLDEVSFKILMAKIGYKKQGIRHKPNDRLYVLSRALQMLMIFKESRSVPLVIAPSKQFDNRFAYHFDNFISYLKLKLRRNDVTIMAYNRNIRSFLDYLEKIGVTELGSINISHVLNYIRMLTPPKGTTPILAIGNIRGFLKYLHKVGVTSNDISAQMPHCKRILQPRLPSTYSRTEIQKALGTIERITPIGKRNYAIFLTIARIGLRVSDVMNLRLKNISWRDNQIRIYQYKTGNPLAIPLPADVGNAIIDYLKYGRSVTEDDHVFLMQRCTIPMTRSAIYTMISKAFSDAKIKTDGKHRGPHSLRHSLSSRMFENNVTIPVITQVLGHENGETTNYYLRIDLTSMSKCILEVEEVDNNFYKRIKEVYSDYIQ